MRLANAGRRPASDGQPMPRGPPAGRPAGEGQAEGALVGGGKRGAKPADRAVGAPVGTGLGTGRRPIASTRGRAAPGGGQREGGIVAVADGAEPLARRTPVPTPGRRDHRTPRPRGRRPGQDVRPDAGGDQGSGNPGDAGGDQSFTTAATVARFDAAAAETWEKLAGLLREARPDAAANWLDDLAARRRQAEAELRAARSIDRGQFGTAAYEQATHARLAHVEAALKLDPTLEDAHGEHMSSLYQECSLAGNNHEGKKLADVAESTLTHALNYLDRFGPHAKYRRAAHDACWPAIYLSLGKRDSPSRPELTPQRLRMVQMAKRVLDDAIRNSDLGTSTMPYGPTGSEFQLSRGDVDHRWADDETHGRSRWPSASNGSIVFCGNAREARLSRRRTNEGVPSDVMRRPQGGGMFWWECDDLWLRAAELAVDDASLDRAQQLVAQLQKRVTATQTQPKMSLSVARRQLLLRLRSVVVRMDDEAQLAEFDRWVQGMRERPVQWIRIQWRDANAFIKREASMREAIRAFQTSPIKGVTLRGEGLPGDGFVGSISALAEGDGRHVPGDHHYIPVETG